MWSWERFTVSEWYPPAEPKNKHESWCNIWTTENLPCNCGAG